MREKERGGEREREREICITANFNDNKKNGTCTIDACLFVMKMVLLASTPFLLN